MSGGKLSGGNVRSLVSHLFQKRRVYIDSWNFNFPEVNQNIPPQSPHCPQLYVSLSVVDSDMFPLPYIQTDPNEHVVHTGHFFQLGYNHSLVVPSCLSFLLSFHVYVEICIAPFYVFTELFFVFFYSSSVYFFCCSSLLMYLFCLSQLPHGRLYSVIYQDISASVVYQPFPSFIFSFVWLLDLIFLRDASD